MAKESAVWGANLDLDGWPKRRKLAKGESRSSVWRRIIQSQAQ